MIIPSIDLMNGKAVQLVNGNEQMIKVERDDPVMIAKGFNRYGELAVIDLDAALGKGENRDLIAQICTLAECRVGGGIRTIEEGDEILLAGAKKIIVGTKADPEFLSSFNKERVIVALDMKGKNIATHGWKQTVHQNPLDRAIELQDYCNEFLFTDVQREGKLEGINLEMAKLIKSKTENQLTYAGGISSIEEIKQLENENINSQIGMALYTSTIRLTDAFVSLIDFEKNNGLVPTVVQEEGTGKVLMVAYSSQESLKETLGDEWDQRDHYAVYFSRSRGSLWKKGESSGNLQKLVKARYDCDRDTLLFVVNQNGNACHTGTKTCFNETKFSVKELERIIQDRKEGPTKIGSYTQRVLTEPGLIEEKLREELSELLEHTDRKNLIWEAADLMYFFVTYLVKHGIRLSEIENELWRRRS